MRYVKRAPYTVKTRTRYAHLSFTDDPMETGKTLRAAVVSDCECGKDGIRNLPEWAAVSNKNSSTYKSSIGHLLEIGAWKVEDEYTDGYEDRYYMISTTGAFYIYSEEMNAFKGIISPKGKMSACPLVGESSTQCAVFTNKGYFLVNADATYQTVISGMVTVPAGAYFRHRVFVGMKNAVLKYSAPGDFTNFTETVGEGGSVRFPDGGGEIIAIKVFDDALYIFFKSGIIRLDVGGDPCDFRAEKISYAGGDIVARTICVCDHAIYFLTRNGIYRLQGTKVERLPLDLPFPLKESGFEGCAVWKGMPVIRYCEKSGAYRTFVIRPDGTLFFMEDLLGLCRGENGRVLFVDAERNLHQLVDDGEGTVWKTGSVRTVKSNFGYVGRKSLRKLCFYGEGSFTVTLSNEGQSYTKTFAFEGGFAEWSLKVPGEYYTFDFTLDRASKIKKVYAEFETLTRYKEGKL